MMDGISSATAGATGAPQAATDAKTVKAARDFEALLIGQMMHQMRESSSLGDGDQSSATIMEMAEEQLSQVLAAGGGLGLGKLITHGLAIRNADNP
jgi:Rod binding domain-containing protein